MKTDVKYTVEAGIMEVSPAGRNLIREYLRSIDIPTFQLRDPRWTWEWIVVKGTYRGKLPKRMAKYINAQYDLNLTAEQVSEIGNIARAHILPPKTYTLDFDKDLDWDAGDFGDHGSCFWGDRSPAREVLHENGVLAIRLFNDSGRGYARAWIYQLDNMWLLFNSYGITTQIMANILSEFLNKHTDKSWEYDGIILTVNNDDDGLIYLNTRPQIIYIKGTSPPEEVNLDWDVGSHVLCYCCDTWIALGEEYFHREHSYCYSCYDDRVVQCSDCGEVIDDKEDEYFHEGEIYCSTCYHAKEDEG